MDIKRNNIYCKRNIGMMMDLYELTMANGYFKQENAQKKVAFDVFFRKNPDQGGFSVFAGLEQIVEYIEGLHFSDADIEYLRGLHLFTEDFLEYLRNFKFTGDVYAFREGTIMYPNEPIITVVADLIQAQIVETEILAQINHQSLIATKARRIVKAANGRPVSDFGARRAHNNDAAIYGARAAFIGGANGTATVSAGQYFDIPIGGTMAHSWVMYYEDELTAFRKFAEVYPDNCILLVDTYDVVKSGIPNAIKVFDEMKANNIESKNFGIRIDSGDLAYLTKIARKMLDKAGYKDAKIVISNSLDEYTITSILSQGGQVDSFGVGERMITSKSEPVFGAVYKLCAVENEGKMEPRIKISEAIEKITNPGLKEVYRIYNEDGQAIADLLAHKDEEVNMEDVYRFIDPEKPWKKREFVNCTAKKLQRLVIKEGKRVRDPEKVTDIANFVKEQLSTEIWEEEQRFENPHKHYLDMTKSYYEMKMNMLDK
ncbi:nicotinate phosphoribosyltransferase [Lachnobacterium bovis]|uniref:Nicotinate phosphoribosyltransferase n=1 Tax=Lachnobacterium bovis TaxID=140626 RepID=A0A1H9TAX3_9FIRM|nr:nicotinate phosphoribosyltransferase [Lachnobacterium bovis]SER94278.1 nicotinate phosphoribosyltransferase [Lachnobacterium bovis]